MILVIGAHGAGKLSFVFDSLGYGREDVAWTLAECGPVLANAQDAVPGRLTIPGQDAFGEVCWDGLVDAMASREVVLLDEVGCGVIPMDGRERAWREGVGRVGCELARRATCVVRVVCGIGQVIKGELPQDPAERPRMPDDDELGRS